MPGQLIDLTTAISPEVWPKCGVGCKAGPRLRHGSTGSLFVSTTSTRNVCFVSMCVFFLVRIYFDIHLPIRVPRNHPKKCQVRTFMKFSDVTASAKCSVTWQVGARGARFELYFTAAQHNKKSAMTQLLTKKFVVVARQGSIFPATLSTNFFEETFC